MQTGSVIQFGVTAESLAAQLDRTGFVCLDNAVSDDWLADARENVQSRIAELGTTDFCITNSGREPDSPAHRIVSDPTVRSMLETLALSRCDWGVCPDEEIFSVLRVLAGPRRTTPYHAYHYDAAVITMLVPLLIPDAGPGKSGELVVLPNRRPFRRSAVIHIAEKMLAQNWLYRNRIKRRVCASPDKYLIKLAPGNVYLFWGYRTLHGNVPCAVGTVRATLLLHFGDPNAGSALFSVVRKLHHRVSPTPGYTEATAVKL